MIVSIIAFVGCKGTSEDYINLENENVPSDSSWPLINKTPQFVFSNTGELKRQILISPDGDTVHNIEYVNGKITRCEGQYFYYATELKKSSNDSTEVIFYHNLVIPDTSLTINLCLFVYDKDSSKYIPKNQYFVNDTIFVVNEYFNTKNPIIYWAMFLTYPDLSTFHYEVHDPYRVRIPIVKSEGSGKS